MPQDGSAELKFIDRLVGSLWIQIVVVGTATAAAACSPFFLGDALEGELKQLIQIALFGAPPGVGLVKIATNYQKIAAFGLARDRLLGAATPEARTAIIEEIDAIARDWRKGMANG